jgi:hypothetical protein
VPFLRNFNVSKLSPITFNSLRQKKALKGWQLDPKIPESIFNLTKGHKGLVGFCGKMLDTKFQHCPSLTDWVTYSRKKLFHHVLEWSTAYRITKTAEKQENKHILERFLCAQGVVHVWRKSEKNCVPLVYFFQRYSLITCRFGSTM